MHNALSSQIEVFYNGNWKQWVLVSTELPKAVEFGHGLPLRTKVSCLVEEGGPCLNQGESRYPCFVLLEGFRRLYYSSDAGLNDIIHALRVFPQHPGRFPHLLWRPCATPVRTWPSANSTLSFYRLRKQIQ